MLKRLTFRTIKKSLSRFLAIFLIAALGVGFYAGLRMCMPDMIDTGREYVDNNNMFDYEIISSLGIDKGSIKIAESSEMVADVEASIEQDIIVHLNKNSDCVLKFISLPNKINKIKLVNGRMPQNANEVLIDSHFEDFSIGLGDYIEISKDNKKSNYNNFRKKKFKIVGTASSPLYMDYQKGTTNIGDGTIQSFVFAQKNAFNADLYTQLYITLKENNAAFSDEYDTYIENSNKKIEKLAKRITEKRYNRIRNSAQKKIDEGKSEYLSNYNLYQNQKDSAYGQLNSAQNKIDKGLNQINSKRKEVKSQIKEMKSNMMLIEFQLAKVNQDIQNLTKDYKDGTISEDEYQEKLDEYNNNISTMTTLKELLTTNLSMAKNGLKTIDKKEAFVRSKEKTVKAETDRANVEFGKAEDQLSKANQKLRNAQLKLDEIGEGDSYVLTRDSNSGYSSFVQNSEIVDNISKIFPLFFFLIAALVCMTTMTRMVDEERTQIGILKALGYSSFAILGKYIFYAGSASITGSIFGYFVGCQVFPAAIWHAYTMMYSFNNNINCLYDLKLGAGCVLAAVICCVGSTIYTCMAELKLIPAELIRPKTPKAGKRILLERIKPLWTRLTFLYKVTFRNIFRYKKRFLLMVIGVSGCTALLIAGFGINTTIKGTAERQFREVSKFDYQLSFKQDMTKQEQNQFIDYAGKKDIKKSDVIFLNTSEVDLEHDGDVRKIVLNTSSDKNLNKFVTLKYKGEAIEYPKEGEVAICSKLHNHSGIDIGDQITIKDEYNHMTLKVSAIYDNYIKEQVYISDKTYENGFKSKPVLKTAFINSHGANDDEIRREATYISNYKDVVVVSVNQTLVDKIADMMKSLNLVVYVIILCAGLLSFIVLYNLTNININERIREIATIKVLGFNRGEVSSYVFRENVFLTLIASLCGIPLGKALLSFVIDNIKIDMIYFVPKITTLDYVYSIIMTFVFTYVVSLAMRRGLTNISMTESLKSIE